MARRQMSKSATPARTLSEINRSNTPAAQSDRALMSPSESSDKENQTTRRVDKGKGRMPPPGKLPTPISDSAGSRGQKRRRAENQEDTPTASRIRLDQSDQEEEEEEGEEEEGEEGEEEEEEDREQVNADEGTPEPASTKYYNPGQNESERRDVKRKSRALEREFNENRDEYLKHDNNGLEHTISEANAIFEGIKQTSDATLDSRLMVSVSDLTFKKSAQLVLGDTSTGVDVDEFVSKCILFMRQGSQRDDDDGNIPTTTQRRRQRRAREDEAEDDLGDQVLDWELLGARACFPNNLRPAVPGFLLGPLSVQKRARAPTQRRTRLAKDAGGQETRPEALTKADLETNESNTVRTICGNIRSRLVQHCQQATAALEIEAQNVEDDELPALMRKHRLTDTSGPSLFDFVINPTSFGQTVENLFYVSFLIKEGEVGIEMDTNGLPTLLPNTESMHESRERRATKHQAVFGIDYSTWQDLVAAFEIRNPLIPHRQTEQNTQVSSRGWYN